MEDHAHKRGSAWIRLRDVARANPFVTGVLVVCLVVGVALGITVLPPEWSIARRVAAGAVSGAGVGLMITAARMIG